MKSAEFPLPSNTAAGGEIVEALRRLRNALVSYEADDGTPVRDLHPADREAVYGLRTAIWMLGRIVQEFPRCETCGAFYETPMCPKPTCQEAFAAEEAR